LSSELERILTPEGKTALDEATEKYRSDTLRRAIELAVRRKQDYANSGDVRQAVREAVRGARRLVRAISSIILLPFVVFQFSVLLQDEVKALSLACQLALWIVPIVALAFVLWTFMWARQG